MLPTSTSAQITFQTLRYCGKAVCCANVLGDRPARWVGWRVTFRFVWTERDCGHGRCGVVYRCLEARKSAGLRKTRRRGSRWFGGYWRLGAESQNSPRTARILAFLRCAYLSCPQSYPTVYCRWLPSGVYRSPVAPYPASRTERPRQASEMRDRPGRLTRRSWSFIGN